MLAETTIFMKSVVHKHLFQSIKPELLQETLLRENILPFFLLSFPLGEQV